MGQMRARAASESPKVLEKALRVLKLFAMDKPEWAENEVAGELDLPVSTAHRLLRALEGHGLLMRTARGRYRLGIEAITLGGRAAATFDLQAALRPVLERLAGRVHETVALLAYEPKAGAALCLDRVEAPSRLRLSLSVNALSPLHAGASARTLLAFLGDDVLADVLRRPLERLGPGTITDPRKLEREVMASRRRGWCSSWQETNEGTWGVAAPVLDSEGIAVAVIAVIGPTVRFSEARRAGFLEAVMAAVQEAREVLSLEPRSLPLGT